MLRKPKIIVKTWWHDWNNVINLCKLLFIGGSLALSVLQPYKSSFTMFYFYLCIDWCQDHNNVINLCKLLFIGRTGEVSLLSRLQLHTKAVLQHFTNLCIDWSQLALWFHDHNNVINLCKVIYREKASLLSRLQLPHKSGFTINYFIFVLIDRNLLHDVIIIIM